MKRRELGPFLATSRRNPAYCIPGGAVWIHRNGARWDLFQLQNRNAGRDYVLYGTFPTLTAAVNHYVSEVAKP